MRSPAAVTDCGTSLLATDPGLGPLLGPRNAAVLGHRPLLPVLAFPAGRWSPPPAGTLGDGTVALVVLAGVLLREPGDGHRRLLGPGDLLEPWKHPAAWRACTPVRAAIIGQAFVRAVAPWPQAAAHMLRRVGADADGLRVGPAGAAPAEQRLTELLWRLAARWGVVEQDGIGLPLALAPAALAGLIGLPESEAARGLQALERARAATRAADGTWLLAIGAERRDVGLAAARDDLRERLAGELARARATQALSAELREAAAVQVRRGQARRRPDETR